MVEKNIFYVHFWHEEQLENGLNNENIIKVSQ
jgi:hypothetical protein